MPPRDKEEKAGAWDFTREGSNSQGDGKTNVW